MTAPTTYTSAPALYAPYTVSDSVSTTNQQDYYKIQLPRRGAITVTLDNLTNNADLRILNYQGNPLTPPVQSNNPGTTSDSIMTTLNPGVYYIEVSNASSGTASYQLTVSASLREVMPNLVVRDNSSGFYSWQISPNDKNVIRYGIGQNLTPDAYAVPGDLDMDGEGDVFLQNVTTGALGIWYLRGNTIKNSFVLSNNVTPPWSIRGVADFNGDGQNDLVWRNISTGENAVWIMQPNGTGFSSIQPLMSAPTSWDIQSVADFDGDGDPDLFWLNNSTGQGGWWEMENFSLVSANPFPTSNLFGWTLAAVGDYGGLIRPDLLWYNYSLGVVGAWVMSNPNTISSVRTYPEVAPNSWVFKGVREQPNYHVEDTSTVSQPLAGYDTAIRRFTFNANSSGGVSKTVEVKFNNVNPSETFRIDVKSTSFRGEVTLISYNLTATSSSLSQVFSFAVPGPNAKAYVDVYRVDQGNSNATLEVRTLVRSEPNVQFSNQTFNGNEGSTGTVQVSLSEAPQSPVLVNFSTGNFLVVDTNNNIQDGTQDTLVFTPTDWNVPKTIWFMAELDGVATNRTTGNVINYSTIGGSGASGSYNIGTVNNTYAPNPSQFNIDLDFRNDNGYWTTARRTIAMNAANAWASRITSEWPGLTLNHTLPRTENDGTYSNTRFYKTKRFVDDLVIFVDTITSTVAGGYGGIEYSVGGWASSPTIKPRVGHIAIASNISDAFLFNIVLHEIGHALGLVGLNWEGYLHQILSPPSAAVFNGPFAKAANGNAPIPLQAQQGPNPVTGQLDFFHPADVVQSIMSYGWTWFLSQPSNIDFAMLADSGYSITGIN